MLIYVFSAQIDLNGIPPLYWHAHEMIFGYALAIIAGFMLTATKNWTNIQTFHGYKLLGLFLLWAIARLVPFAGDILPIVTMAIADILFISILLIHLSILIIKANQYRQIIILLMLLLLAASNIAFYAGLLSNDPTLMSKGNYTGFYLILTMIIVMGGRVIPFFIERGVGYSVELKTKKWLDISCISIFVIFWIIEIYTTYRDLNTVIVGVLFILHAYRMFGWHTAGIWKKPLLWVLYIAYGMLVMGFLLKLLSVLFGISPFLATHAFGYGGVGVLTLGMMCRIIWGHTGQEISSPPGALPLIFIPIILGAIVRSVMPIFIPEHYLLLMGISQVLWILAFAIFLYIYVPVLIAPRIDGKYG